MDLAKAKNELTKPPFSDFVKAIRSHGLGQNEQHFDEFTVFWGFYQDSSKKLQESVLFCEETWQHFEETTMF